MKVKELIEELSLLDGESLVVQSSDGEGNNFSPLADISPGVYQADSTWSGDVYDTTWSAEDACFESEAEWERFKKETPKCIVLWPTN